MTFKDKIFEAFRKIDSTEKHIDENVLNLLKILQKEEENYNEQKKLKQKIEEDFPNKYTMFPIQDNKTWQNYKQAERSFWTAEEIDLEQDKKDWEKLSSEEKSFIKSVLAFFAASDGIVLENLASRFMEDIPISEVRAFYGFQIAMENIHSETYSLLIQELIPDKKEQNKLFNAVQNYPIIKKKADWAIKWIESSNNLMERLIAFICVEGIFFSSSFACLFWLKKKGKMPGLTFSNELISRDEGSHVREPVHLVTNILSKYIELPTKKRILEIFTECVTIEKEFVRESLKCNLIGINSNMMCQYVECVADKILTMLGYDKHYNTNNPFPWMDFINIEGKTNQFERRVGEYKKSSSKNIFRTDIIV
jgi:ribonucleoside-diphosphate reductase subunit M2